MTGVKGKSGGARKGTGGARPGAGRKKKEPAKLNLPSSVADCLLQKDPLVFLTLVMNDAGSDAKLRVDAAKALMPFTHQKKGEGGKKEEKQAAAGKASAGKFAPAAPPRLVSSRS